MFNSSNNTVSFQAQQACASYTQPPTASQGSKKSPFVFQLRRQTLEQNAVGYPQSSSSSSVAQANPFLAQQLQQQPQLLGQQDHLLRPQPTQWSSHQGPNSAYSQRSSRKRTREDFEMCHQSDNIDDEEIRKRNSYPRKRILRATPYLNTYGGAPHQQLSALSLCQLGQSQTIIKKLPQTFLPSDQHQPASAQASQSAKSDQLMEMDVDASTNDPALRQKEQMREYMKAQMSLLRRDMNRASEGHTFHECRPNE